MTNSSPDTYLKTSTPRAGRPIKLPAGIDVLPSGKFRARLRRSNRADLTQSFTRLADANGWLRKLKYEQERGLWLDTRTAERITLVRAMDYFVGEYQRDDPHRGIEVERATLATLRDYPIARRTLPSITSENVEALRDHWRSGDDPYAVSTINRRLGLLSAVFAAASVHWKAPGLTNPFHGKKLRGEKKRARRVSEREMEDWLAASGSPDLSAFMRLAVESAMRRGELAALEWKHVHLKRRVAFLPMTKNGEAREVSLSSAAVKCLEEIRPGNGKVFRARPHSYSTAARRALRRARARYVERCAADGVEPSPDYLLDVHLHDLRHEAASRLAPKFQAHELAKITGHKDPRMMMRYYHADAEELAKRMD